MTTQRERFEEWVAKPPREFDLDRFDDDEAWPGSYVAYNVECAWQAWQEAERQTIERCAKDGSIRERVARAICTACEENPDHRGDARGNDYRWQDYLETADAAIRALGADDAAT